MDKMSSIILQMTYVFEGNDILKMLSPPKEGCTVETLPMVYCRLLKVIQFLLDEIQRMQSQCNLEGSSQLKVHRRGVTKFKEKGQNILKCNNYLTATEKRTENLSTHFKFANGCLSNLPDEMVESVMLLVPAAELSRLQKLTLQERIQTCVASAIRLKSWHCTECSYSSIVDR